jgi:hypothetical protein
MGGPDTKLDTGGDSGEVKLSSNATHLTDAEGRLPLWTKLVYAVPRFSFRGLLSAVCYLLSAGCWLVAALWVVYVAAFCFVSDSAYMHSLVLSLSTFLRFPCHQWESIIVLIQIEFSCTQRPT